MVFHFQGAVRREWLALFERKQRGCGTPRERPAGSIVGARGLRYSFFWQGRAIPGEARLATNTDNRTESIIITLKEYQV